VVRQKSLHIWQAALATSLVITLSACTGSNGPAGPAGTAGSVGATGATGANGHTTLTVTTQLPVGSVACPTGGVQISEGVDTNGDGSLESSEVTSRSDVCAGPPGPGITWVDETGTSVQAVAGTGYLADSTSLLTVKLPSAPAVGTIVSVTGVNSGGWTIAQNSGQYIYTTGLPGNPVPGANWTQQNFPAGQNVFTAAASSANGLNLIIGNEYNDLATSADGGVTWVAQAASGGRLWYAVASSADGVALAAADNSPGYIYTSSNSGLAWTQQTGSGMRNWYGVASSADGTKLAAVDNGGYVYTSTDAGVTWTQQTGSGVHTWYGIASSADGTRLVAVEYGGYIYTSSDSGATWTQQTGSGTTEWYSVASSSDGMKLVAVDNNTNLGFVWTSADYGVTWTQTNTYQQTWTAVACSSDCRRILASGNYTDGGGFVFTSFDFGVTWTQANVEGGLNGEWLAAASSSSGSRLLVADTNTGNVFTSLGDQTTPGTAGSLSGGQNDSVELQYVGDGVFIVLAFTNNSGRFYID